MWKAIPLFPAEAKGGVSQAQKRSFFAQLAFDAICLLGLCRLETKRLYLRSTIYAVCSCAARQTAICAGTA